MIHLKNLRLWALKRSLWVFHVNSGSCNGCDIEIVDALTPRYDVERFGIRLVGSPRHADVLLITGPITSKNLPRILRIYEQVPEPKFVMVIGSCAASAGLFRGSYNILSGIDSVLPVDVYVIGCPVRPEAIIDGFIKIIEKIERVERGEDRGKPIVIGEHLPTPMIKVKAER